MSRHSVVRRSLMAAILIALVIYASGVVPSRLVAAGAGGLLHPMRVVSVHPPPAGCSDEVFTGFEVTLAGWRCPANGARRGSVIYLHGVADNSGSAVTVIDRFVGRGFDVVAYDSRAHGSSTGEFCTYGFYEKEDLRLVIDTLEPGPVVLIGASLGGAVALQHAARDRRVTAVVAAETFSDLRTIAAERAPSFFTDAVIARALALAERIARFRVDDVSPLRAAEDIKAPVLLVHGADDVDTPPAHSQRVLARLHSPNRLILVPHAGHNGSLRPEVWDAIDAWLTEVLAGKVADDRRLQLE